MRLKEAEWFQILKRLVRAGLLTSTSSLIYGSSNEDSHQVRCTDLEHAAYFLHTWPSPDLEEDTKNSMQVKVQGGCLPDLREYRRAIVDIEFEGNTQNRGSNGVLNDIAV